MKYVVIALTMIATPGIAQVHDHEYYEQAARESTARAFEAYRNLERTEDELYRKAGNTPSEIAECRSRPTGVPYCLQAFRLRRHGQ